MKISLGLTFVASLLGMSDLDAHSPSNKRTGAKLMHEEKILISHSLSSDVEIQYLKIKNRISNEGDKIDASVSEQISLLDQLADFDFGQFLIANGGINGAWTRYMVLYPTQSKEISAKQLKISELEKWLLERAPAIKATQERFTHFQKLLATNIRSNMKVASIPCGMMDDLLLLDYSKLEMIKLYGIDLDETSLEGAKKTAREKNLSNNVLFVKRDAWHLNIFQEFDIITSNGLNIYESNNEKVVELYKQFYQALKPKGVLITSFLTPPPTLDKSSPWKMERIDADDLRRQKIIFLYLLNAKWQAFRSEALTIQQLQQVGFKEVKIIWDNARIFPTVVAIK